MKRKIAVLLILPLIAALSSCENTQDAPNSAIHGDIGTRAQSQNTNYIAPDRPTNQ
jgi:hypothetical protein